MSTQVPKRDARHTADRRVGRRRRQQSLRTAVRTALDAFSRLVFGRQTPLSEYDREARREQVLARMCPTAG